MPSRAFVDSVGYDDENNPLKPECWVLTPSRAFVDFVDQVAAFYRRHPELS